MLRAEIHDVRHFDDGEARQTSYILSADLDHWSTEVLEDLTKRVIQMHQVDAEATRSMHEEDDE